MLDHPIIDVALGLIFFYVVLSLVASAVQEWIASLCALRSKNLFAGIQRLVGDKYAQSVYDHPLINNLAKANKRPSYIAPETLSAVLLEVVAKENSGKSYVSHSAEDVREVIGKIPDDHPLKGILETLISKGEGAAEGLREKLADWFDEGMTRVSGWYKRRVKVIIILIAATVTIGLNASTIQMAEELWRNDTLRTLIAAQAQTAAGQSDIADVQAENLKHLEAFPVGWSKVPDGAGEWSVTVIGWIITIAAISLGAPFWFDLLGKVANLKGSGGKALGRPSKGG